MTILYDYKETFDLIKYDVIYKPARLLELNENITLYVPSINNRIHLIWIFDTNINTNLDDTYIIKFENQNVEYIETGYLIKGTLFGKDNYVYKNNIKTMYNNCTIKSQLSLSNDGDRFDNCIFEKPS